MLYLSFACQPPGRKYILTHLHGLIKYSYPRSAGWPDGAAGGSLSRQTVKATLGLCSRPLRGRLSQGAQGSPPGSLWRKRTHDGSWGLVVAPVRWDQAQALARGLLSPQVWATCEGGSSSPLWPGSYLSSTSLSCSKQPKVFT